MVKREVEVEREEEKTVVKRTCVSPFSSDVFEESRSAEVLGDFGSPGWGLLWGLWWFSSVCGSAGSPGVSGVFGVPNSPWLVGELGANSLSVSDCEFVVPQSFFLQKASSLPVGMSRR